MENRKELLKQMQLEYIKIFEQNWNHTMDELFFKQEQFIAGNRLRPYIVLVGYLATKSKFELSTADYDKISRLSICIELIHKASLILDDLIDGDPARHGKKAFHIEYGTENTMMFAINLLSISVKKMHQFISETKENSVLKQKGIDLLTKTMYDMSLGELMELNLDSQNRYNVEKVKEIINLETSPLISNSLLFGYYAGNGDDKETEETLRLIGYQCGYIFQAMNDLEPFCQQEKLERHKGRLNTDIIQSRKNIALVLLYNLISEKEKRKIETAESIDKMNTLLIDFFNYYKVKDSLMREIELIYQNIQEEIHLLNHRGVNSTWCELFQYFINLIIKECENRLL